MLYGLRARLALHAPSEAPREPFEEMRNAATVRWTGPNLITPRVAERLVPDALERGASNAGVNAPINLGHALDAAVVQRWVQSSNPNESLTPVWSTLAQWASAAAGDGMLGAEAALDAIAQLRTRAKSAQDLVKEGPAINRAFAVRLGKALNVAGFSKSESEDAAAVLSALAVGNVKALRDPRVLATVSERMAGLLWEAHQVAEHTPGASRDLLGSVETIARTLDTLLGEGNQRIWEDMGGTVSKFLALAESGAIQCPQDVVERLAPELEGASPEAAREVLAWAKPRLGQRLTTAELEAAPHADQSNNLVVAAHALYAEARFGSLSTAEKNERISLANDLILYREQHDLAAAAFNATKPGEVDRASVIHAITPLMQVPFAGTFWKLSKVKTPPPEGANAWGKLMTRLHDFISPPVLHLNWADFDDRFPKIQTYEDVVADMTPQLLAGNVPTSGAAADWMRQVTRPVAREDGSPGQ